METGPQREFTRIPIGVEAKVETADRTILSSETMNVSMKGILVRTEEQLPAGTECEITLYLNHGEIRIEAHGSVVRAYAEGIAIQFDRLNGVESYEHLRNLVRYNATDLEKVEEELHAHLGIRKRE